MKKLLRVLCCLILSTVCQAQTAGSRPPNIIFILIDDMGWADGECFGSKFYQTPGLNRLSAQGLRFTSAYASCAVCSPTRAAIQTGKSPARLHLTDWIPGEGTPKNSRFTLPLWQKSLLPQETTLAEALKKRGYATAHIGKWHLGGPECFPEKQGFDLNIAGGHIGHPASYFWPYGEKGNSHQVPGLAEKGGKEGEYLTDRLTDEAIAYISSHQDKPFYLQLAHYAVHGPLQGKKDLIEEAATHAPSNGQANTTYAAMIRSMDESVSRILAKLDELKLSDHTIVVFTSDNGGVVHFGTPTATSNAPLRQGKGFAYEGGLRVPLIVKVPGMTKAGQVSDVPVISTDFFPTLLELVGAPPEASATAVDGISFAPVLRGEKSLPRDTFFWHYPHYWNGGAITPYSVIRSGNWKLIRFYETGKEELYDLGKDLSETTDLAPGNPAKAGELSGKLDAWLASVGAQLPVAR